MQIRFDGPPGPEAGRFVEVEDDTGKSISAGEWVQDGEYWLLKLTPQHTDASVEGEKQRDRVITYCASVISEHSCAERPDCVHQFSRECEVQCMNCWERKLQYIAEDREPWAALQEGKE